MPHEHRSSAGCSTVERSHAVQFFRIAGELVAAEGDLLPDTWAEFVVPSAEDIPICRIRKEKSATLYGIESVAPTHPIVHMLRVGQAVLLGDRDFTRMTLCGRGESHEGLLLSGLSARLSLCHVVLIHGALVEIPSIGGVLFIGASGVGKSTQAELWQQHRDAHILNGDRVFLRMPPHASEAVGYGSPFAGSSSYRVNGEASVIRVVELKRDREAKLVPLPPDEALTALFCRALIPSWDAAMSALTAGAAEVLTRISTAVPMVSLSVPNHDPLEGLRLLETALVRERREPWNIPTAG